MAIIKKMIIPCSGYTVYGQQLYVEVSSTDVDAPPILCPVDGVYFNNNRSDYIQNNGNNTECLKYLKEINYIQSLWMPYSRK
jgi:hypothetical protein